MKTHEEHVRRVASVHGDRLIVVGHYTHSHVKVEYVCPVHGRFTALSFNIEAGNGCRSCANEKKRISPEVHAQRVHEIHGDRLRVVDPYVDATTKIRYKCSKHGIFTAIPNNVVNGSGCRRCYDETIAGRSRKKHSTYISQAKILGLVVLDTYVTAHTPIRHRCIKGHVWVSAPNQILSGYGCPLCDNSQYRRRPVRVGNREVMVQGAEGTAVGILLKEGVDPQDLAFTVKEGRPTFRYAFAHRLRVYVPDMFKRSTREVIEVKSAVTLGLYDNTIFAQVKAKARSVVSAGYPYRLMVIHRRQNIDLGRNWYRQSLREINRTFKEKAHAQDRRH